MDTEQRGATTIRTNTQGAKPGSQQGSVSPQKKPASGLAPNVEGLAAFAAAAVRGGADDGGRDSVTLSLRVSLAKNIRGSKAERVNSLVRVQFADFDFKDSPIVNDTPNPEYNFGFDTQLPLDETLIETFANNKVTVTLIESLPKEKTQILGSAEFSLVPFFLKYPVRDPASELPPQAPPLAFKEAFPIVYLNPKMLATTGKGDTVDDSLRPEFVFEAALSKPLVPPEVMEHSNFLTFKIEDMFPVPDDWTLKEGNENNVNSNIYQYGLAINVPADGEGMRSIALKPGSLVACDIPMSAVMAATPATAASAASPNSLAVGTAAVNDALGGSTIALASEKKENIDRKVSWNMMSYTAFLNPDAIAQLREKVIAKKPLELELTRELQPKFATVQDPVAAKFRGKVSVDCSNLLFPKVLSLKGRFAVDSTYVGPDSAGVDATKAKKSNIYRSLGTSVALEINLEKTLLSKKKLQPVSKTVRDFVPKRTLPDQGALFRNSMKATDEFRNQIKGITVKLAKEYRHLLQAEAERQGLFGEQEVTPAATVEEEQLRKKKFLFQLNRSGVYASFKEQLKGAVVNVVRERFRKKSPFASKNELQLFMSEIYVYLIDQMHVTINSIFSQTNASVDLVGLDEDEAMRSADYTFLKEFADLAEADNDILIADMYHRERCTLYDDKVQVFYDYACFCMRSGMSDRAEENFKEILAQNSKHIPCLISYGAVCSTKERFEEARVYLHAAAALQPNYVLPWIILSLVYDTMGEELESERALEEAAKIEAAVGEQSNRYYDAAQFLINCHAGTLAERALALQFIRGGASTKAYLMLTQLEMQRLNYANALDHVRSALELRPDDADAWAQSGHVSFLDNNFDTARVAYETVLSLSSEPADLPLVYSRLGAIYLTRVTGKDEKNDVYYAKLAKTMYLRACEISPSSQTWLGVGRACYVLGNFEEAEDALGEANILNNRDAQVWAYLALLSLRLKRDFEAKQCVAQALRIGVKKSGILRELGDAFVEASQTSPAIECYRMCLELDPDNEQVRKTFTKILTQASGDFLYDSDRAPDNLEVSGARGGPSLP